MKIIKPGNSDSWTCTYTCTGCGSVVEADEKDLEPHGYRGAGNTVAFVRCIVPDCGGKKGFAWSDFPLPVYNRLNARRAEKPQPGLKD